MALLPLVNALVRPLVPRSLRPLVAEKAYTARALAEGGPATFAAVAQAWRPHMAASALAGAVLLATRPRTRVLAAGLAAAGLAAGAPVGRRAARKPGAAPGPGDVTVVTANVRHGSADTGALAALVADERPDFVVLPEAGADFRDKLMPLLAGLGYRAWVASGGRRRDGGDVVLLVGERAGDVRVRPGHGMRLPHLEATGGILGERTLYAVHPTAPMSRRSTAWWHDELALIGSWCSGPVAPLVAGDFNATLDHPALRAALGRCRSAADGTGRGLAGTFPAGVPRWLGIQIDHVLVPADAVTTRFEVLDLTGSDHRAVLARLRLTG
ncbi:endonuclease/exonuclease/phosphatase (EEP) superfamily protein YafD [Pseudonocardia hierapolitana]|uniref:Endonuclease/exonuclease/phosphatase (EEP) superfamily protein YafD n=1 Tax=Pseudonocardia hierapolitana TaxID=1128676 RepID=A0A561SYF0_9PSEU|nr:endonuclease/exonuclease/phosphatase family protein [Pseudonocardia hierapolitana]TWF79890.1 endonuclease/exonuclease/phosphatase (EEP) superfamily protein YafD [Pseudonocardia hierapolitana]